MNFFLLILIFVFACASKPDENCICKIETLHIKETYCGFELRDPNCYPHAEYKCENGGNGQGSLMRICHSTICNFYMDTAGCGATNAFEKGVRNGGPRCEGCYFYSDGANDYGTKSYYSGGNLTLGHKIKFFTRVGEKWQEMPHPHPKTLSNTLPLPRERVKALKN